MHGDKQHGSKKKVSWQIVNLFSERRKILRTVSFMQKQRKKRKVYLTWKLHNSASKQLNIHSSVHRKERKMSSRNWMLQKRKKRYDMFSGWSISNIATTNSSSRQHLKVLGVFSNAFSVKICRLRSRNLQKFSALKWFSLLHTKCFHVQFTAIFPLTSPSHKSHINWIIQKAWWLSSKAAWINFQRHFCKPPEPAALENIKILFPSSHKAK